MLKDEPMVCLCIVGTASGSLIFMVHLFLYSMLGLGSIHVDITRQTEKPQ